MLLTIHDDVAYHTRFWAREAIRDQGATYCEALTQHTVMGKRIRCTKLVDADQKLCTVHRRMQ